MRMSKLTKITILAAAVMLAAVSCKKDKEETSKETLPTYPKFTVPEYASVHDEIFIEPGGVTHPKDGKLVWSAKVAGIDTTITLNEVEGKFRFVVLDTLGTYTVTLSAADEAEEYYSVSSSKSIIAVRGGVNVPGGELLERTIKGRASDDYGEASVVSFGQDNYFYTTVGGVSWLCENLWTSDNGVSYNDYSILDSIYGRYYSWEDAQSACPNGWRLPSETDWEHLATSLNAEKSGDKYLKINGKLLAADAECNGVAMWEWWPRGDETPSGFDALPTGYVNLVNKSWNGLNVYAAFWTSNEENGLGVYRYMTVDGADLMKGTQSKTDFGASVRCIKEGE